MTLTPHEATLKAPFEKCRHCGQVAGVEFKTNINNNGQYLVCKGCGASHPWPNVMFLKVGDIKRRKPLPGMDTDVADVWQKHDCCVLCDRSSAELTKLGIGRQRHHTPRYSRDGHAGTLLPLCSECHEVVNHLQRRADKLRQVLHLAEGGR